MNPLPEGNDPVYVGNHVVIPLALFHRLCFCYYGIGPRAWETADNREKMSVVRLSDKPVPPTTEQHTESEHPKKTPDPGSKSEEAAKNPGGATLRGVPRGWTPRGKAAEDPLEQFD